MKIAICTLPHSELHRKKYVQRTIKLDESKCEFFTAPQVTPEVTHEIYIYFFFV